MVNNMLPMSIHQKINFILIVAFFQMPLWSSSAQENNGSQFPPRKLFNSSSRFIIVHLKTSDQANNKYIDSLISDSLKWRPLAYLSAIHFTGKTDIFLKTTLPRNKWKEPAIYVSGHAMAYEIFIGRTKVFEYGISRKSKMIYMSNQIIPLDSAYQGKTCVFRQHYENFKNMGYLANLEIGSKDDFIKLLIEEDDERRQTSILEVVIAIFQVLVGVIALYVFVLRRRRLEWIFLFFGIFSLSSGIDSCFDYMYRYLQISPSMYLLISLTSANIIPIGLIGFTKELTHTRWKSFLGLLMLVCIAYACLCPFLSIAFPYQISYKALIFLCIFGCISAVIRSKIYKQPVFRIPLAAALILLLLATNDFLIWSGMPSVHYSFYNWGMLLLFLAFGYYIEKNYRETQLKMQKYSLELEISKTELQKLEKKNIQSQFESLQDQLNSYFLFSSLNSLTSIIRNEPKKAMAFVEEFPDVYRYVLDVKEKNLVQIKEEVAFLESYTKLQQVRFGDKLQVIISLNEETLDGYIPPLTLQMLIENAIKHSDVSEAFPLKIQILSDNGFVKVVNNLQPIKNVHTKVIELKNIIDRYSYFTEIKPQFFMMKDEYIAKVPIIEMDC
jgi:hypothetical protein